MKVPQKRSRRRGPGSRNGLDKKARSRLQLLEAALKRAQEALRRERAYAAALHETALDLLRQRCLTELLRTIVARAGALVDTPHGSVYLREPDGETLRVRVGLGWFRRCAGRRLRPGEGLAGRVWQTGQPLVVDDYGRWPGRVPDPAYDAIRAAVGLPLKPDPAQPAVGVLVLAHFAPHRRFHAEHVALLERFAELAAVALKTAQLCEEKVQAERRYRHLFERVPIGLYRTTPDGRLIDANPALLELLKLPSGEAARRFHVAEGYVDLKDRERWQRAMARHGVVRNFEYRVRRRDGVVIWVRDNARAVKDPQGRVLYYEGSLEDITAEKQALELQRALASKVLQAQEQERLHIARELHDALGQLLTALKLNGEWLLHHAEDARTREVARKLCQCVDRAMHTVRELSRGLRPALLDELGIGAALEALVAELQPQTDVRLRLDVGPLPEAVPSEVATALYRIAQEALTNVLRHAQARQARVTLRARRGALVLRVADDGRGIPEALLRDPRSLGLAGMRERAALLRGTLRVRRRPGGGTVVVARIPLGEREPGRRTMG